jgi:hypothetical protein
MIAVVGRETSRWHLLWGLPGAALIRALPLPAGAERVIAPLAQRLTEILPADEFEVEVRGTTLAVRSLRRPGASLLTGALFELRLPLPMALRLRVYFENQADSLQDFVSEVKGTEWPAAGAKPRVRVTDEEVHVWYGSGDEATQR